LFLCHSSLSDVGPVLETRLLPLSLSILLCQADCPTAAVGQVLKQNPQWEVLALFSRLTLRTCNGQICISCMVLWCQRWNTLLILLYLTTAVISLTLPSISMTINLHYLHNKSKNIFKNMSKYGGNLLFSF